MKMESVNSCINKDKDLISPLGLDQGGKWAIPIGKGRIETLPVGIVQFSNPKLTVPKSQFKMEKDPILTVLIRIIVEKPFPW